MLLTEAEVDHMVDHPQLAEDRSLTTRILNPIFDVLVHRIPNDVSPNVISLAALLCLVHAWYISYNQGK